MRNVPYYGCWGVPVWTQPDVEYKEKNEHPRTEKTNEEVQGPGQIEKNISDHDRAFILSPKYIRVLSNQYQDVQSL